MAFYGKYGNLPSVEAAQLSLKDIADNVTWDELNKADDEIFPVPERHAAIRLCRMIESLQMVIYLNGGKQPVTWLPTLYKIPTEYGNVSTRSRISVKVIEPKQLEKK